MIGKHWTSSFLALLLQTTLIVSTSWAWVPHYLDCEEPDAYFGTDARGDYFENGRMHWRESNMEWGSHEFDMSGRHPSSPRCIKIIMPPDNRSSSEQERNRHEWAFNDLAPNSDIWEGWSIKFADDFPCFNGSVAMFHQWKNHSHMPAIQINLGKNSDPNGPLEVYTSVIYGTDGDNSFSQDHPSRTVIPRGEWVDFILNYNVSNNGPGGYFKMWINGTQVADYSGPVGFGDATANGNPKIGLYYLYSQPHERIVWLDELRWGSSYEDVDPSIDRFANRVATPFPSPRGGSYIGPQTISLGTTTSGADIYYSLNGTDPTQSSTLYTSPFLLSQSATLKARAYKSGLDESIVYTSAYAITPYPDGYLAVLSVTASADDGNVPQNTIDGSLSSRWSAQGAGQWIMYDLGSVKTVRSVWIAWHVGNTRTANFDILVSENGTDFTDVLTNQTSSGTTLNMEEHSFAPVSARYVRIRCNGNSGSDWNSITETMISGDAVATREAFLSPAHSVSSPGAGVVYCTLNGRQIRRRSTLSTASVVFQHTKGRNSQGMRRIVTIPR